MSSQAPALTMASPHRFLLPVLAFCQLIVAIDYNIVLVALPKMQEALGFSPTSLQWVVSAYSLAFGGILLFAGRFTDLFGRRTGMVLGLALYGLGSLTAAVASDPVVVLVGRVAQGLGGALLTPSMLATIFTSFAEGPERFRALGVWSAAGGVGLAAGSAFGGVLTDSFGWRAVFLVNVPLTVVALVGAMVTMPRDYRPEHRKSLDVPGAVLATLASTAIVFALAQGSARGWGTASVLVAAVLGLAALAAFVQVERTSPDPLLPLPMLRNRTLSTGLVSMVLFMGSIGTSYYVFTLFLQDVLGESSLVTGLSFLPWGLGGIAGTRVAQRALNRYGINSTLAAGMIVGAAGTAGLGVSLQAGAPLWALIAWTLLLALGQAMGFVSLFASAAAGAAPGHQGSASALMSTCQQIGNAGGVSLLGSLAASIASRSGAVTAADTVLGLRTATGIAAGLLVVGAVAAVGGGRRAMQAAKAAQAAR